MLEPTDQITDHLDVLQALAEDEGRVALAEALTLCRKLYDLERGATDRPRPAVTPTRRETAPVRRGAREQLFAFHTGRAPVMPAKDGASPDAA